MIEFNVISQRFLNITADEAIEMYELAEQLTSPGAAGVQLPKWALDYIAQTVPDHMAVLAKGTLLPIVIYRSLLYVDKDWIRFLHGRWQPEIPQKSGQFYRRTKDGFDGGKDTVYQDDDGRFKQASSAGWGGDYWSEPTPKLRGAK